MIVLAFLCVVAMLSYRASLRLNVPGHPDGNRWVLQDFRDAVYYPVVAVLHGDNPYDAARYMGDYPVWFPYPLYTPVNLVIHLPFGLLPFETSERAYYFAALVLTLVLARLSLRSCGLAADWASTFGVATLMLLSRPGQMNLLLGQVALQGVIGVYLALAYARTRPWLAGLGLALSMFKPSFGVPLAFLMLCRGDVRAVIIGTAVAAAISLIVTAVLLHASGGITPFVAALVDTHHRFAVQAFNAPMSSPFRIDTPALLARLFHASLGNAGELAIGLGILCIGAWGIRRVTARREPTAASGQLTVMLACLTVLTCTYHQAYDWLLLSAPVMVLLTGSWLPRRSPLLRWLLVALLAIPAVNYLASATVIDRLGIGGVVWLATTSINPATLLLAWFLCVMLALRPGGSARLYEEAH